MGRPLGSKDSYSRNRSKETEEQKAGKAKRKLAEHKAAKSAGRERMAKALGGSASGPRAGAGAGQNTAAPGSGGATGITGAGVGAGGAAVAGGVAVAASPAVAAAQGAAPGASSASDPSQDISASLDDDDHRIPQDSVMGQYLKAVFMRLKYEVSTKFVGLEEDKWLLGMLKDDDWWLRANFAHRVCKQLKLQYTEENKFYFRDIKVWLPDQQWGLKRILR